MQLKEPKLNRDQSKALAESRTPFLPTWTRTN